MRSELVYRGIHSFLRSEYNASSKARSLVGRWEIFIATNVTSPGNPHMAFARNSGSRKILGSIVVYSSPFE